ncbi:chorismate mutase [Streptomyces sp. NPDC046985]|uniref:chorismate mutase n=1 Tax=Streptomyces sp. NPDC046985 TaxID=3155377 RepID=UPI0033D7ECF4
MAVRAVRGAVPLERDEAGHMKEQVEALLTAVLERDDLTVDDLISIWFTATPDLHSEFPAAAARGLGIVDVPLICAAELDVGGAMPRVVRVLAHVESDRPRTGIAHVCLGAAAAPREDVAP